MGDLALFVAFTLGAIVGTYGTMFWLAWIVWHDARVAERERSDG